MVEFAVTAPIVFLMFFAAFEFCRVAMIRHTVDNAVYEAARASIVPGSTAGQARAKAREILSTLGLQRANIRVTPRVLEPETPEVTVRIRVPIDGNTFAPSQFFNGRRIERTLTLSREGGS